MNLNILKISVPILMIMGIQNGDGMNEEIFTKLRKVNHPKLVEWKERHDRARSYGPVSFDIICGVVDSRTLNLVYLALPVFAEAPQRREETHHSGRGSNFF